MDYGNLYSEDGDLIYSGDFKNDKYEGFGELHQEFDVLFQVSEGSLPKFKHEIILEKYIGDFKGGKKNGDGIVFNRDGSTRYEGKFVNDYFHGEGKYYYPNGDFYIGSFEFGKKVGEGTLYDKEKNILYSGNYINDRHNGFGIKFYPNRNYYEGEFYKGFMHGKGSLYYKDGKFKYEGNFSYGVCEDESKNFDQEGNEKCMSDKILIKFANALDVINKITGENKNNDLDDEKKFRKSIHDINDYYNDMNRKLETDSDNDEIFGENDDENEEDDYKDYDDVKWNLQNLKMIII